MLQKDKRWFWFTVMVCLTDCILPFFLAPLYPGFQHRYDVLSKLGNRSSPVRIIFNCWMLVLGCSFVVLAFHIRRVCKKEARKATTLLFIITIAYAVFDCIISAFFAVGDSSEMLTIPQKIHGYGSAIGCTLFAFSGMYVAVILWGKHRKLAIGMLVDFVLCLLTFILFVNGEKVSAEVTGQIPILGYTGLWQRVSFVFMYLPYIGLISVFDKQFKL